MNKPIAPCKVCKEREVGCHTNCGRYKEYVEARGAWTNLVNANKDKMKEVRIGRWYR